MAEKNNGKLSPATQAAFNDLVHYAKGMTKLNDRVKGAHAEKVLSAMAARKVFDVCLLHEDYINNDNFAQLSLPATPYQLVDAFDMARAAIDAKMTVEVVQYHRCAYLSELVDGTDNIHHLNALALKIAELDDQGLDIFEGLVKMEQQNSAEISIGRLYDLACSIDCCHHIAEDNDKDLGHFYVDNGFLPELEHVPDSVVELLDFEEIGRKMRKEEGGVFLAAGTGYVVRDGEIKEEFKNLTFEAKEPNYTVLVEIGKIDSKNSALVPLPAETQEMDVALDQVGARTWSEVSLRCADCRVPELIDAISVENNIALANRAANFLSRIPADELPKYKAILKAQGFTTVSEALALAAKMDDYVFAPEFRDASDVGREELRMSLDEEDFNAVLPFVQLGGFGNAVLARDNAIMTLYGSIERKDGEPIIKAGEEAPEQSGMEMM